ncbi:MAG TPA: tyrosine-type recombinase/integrase [Terriglobia bacterium]|nr:tyrosine-type recombinase/integrase [Terriglobia bacterium]
MRKRHTSTGFLSTIQRKSGAVLVYRWYEPGPNGDPREHKRVLGLAKQFRSEAAARREVERLGLGRRLEDGPRNFKELVDHWLEKECSTDDGPESRRAFSTKDTYRGYLRKWIVPRWGNCMVEEVKATTVEEWLATLKKSTGDPMAPGSKKKIRDLMHVLFAHAIRYEWTDRNPISAVRQGGQRLSTPVRLDVDQLSRLVYQVLGPRERTMVLLAFGAGLRRGELSGVKWEDLDFEEKQLTPRRSIVKQRVGNVKTEKSKNPVPLDDDLIDELLAWRGQTSYAANTDYVFASPKMKGKQPYWMSRIMQHNIKPAAAKAGIGITGWHTLRHSYTTLLRQNNNDPKVVQALLRHNSIKVTMDVYDEAMSNEKQIAHRKVLRLVTRKRNRTVTRTASQAGVAASS